MARDPLASFFLVEEYPATAPGAGTRRAHLSLPARDRRPTDPGFVLSWQEYPASGGSPTRRHGIVLTQAPPARSVWVVPDDPHPGDGYAVLVRDVTADSATAASRQVGGPGDFASTAAWQSPRGLPRAWLRVDTVHVGGDDPDQPAAYLHARTDCPHPEPVTFMNITVTRGQPVAAETCYVFGHHLHPASIRPTAPRIHGYDPYVGPCGHCLRLGTPP